MDVNGKCMDVTLYPKGHATSHSGKAKRIIVKLRGCLHG